MEFGHETNGTDTRAAQAAGESARSRRSYGRIHPGGRIEPGETPARARTDSYDLSLASTYFVKGYGTFRHQ